jgi:mannose-6-phosphate isomerase-like protein (cupin superfamily)
MNSLESYKIKEKGYHPFLIRDGWQVAQLNYMEEQDIENINKIDIHFKTDEAFVLLKGNAVLITAILKDKKPIFFVKLMERNITYNVPKNVWHNIAMKTDCEVLIIEKSYTHLGDFEFFYLNEEHVSSLKEKVIQAFDDINHKKRIINKK